MEQEPTQQRDELWERVSADPYAVKPGLNDGVRTLHSIASGALTIPLAPLLIMSFRGDPLAKLHWSRLGIKPIHRDGSMAKGTYRTNSGEEIPVLIRISLAAPPGLFGNVPGVAITFFKKGQLPETLFMMYGTDPVASPWIFTYQPVSNHLPPAQGLPQRLGALAFKVVSSDPFKMEAPEILTDGRAGVRVTGRSNPELVDFMPLVGADFRDYLELIRPGTQLFTLSRELEPGGTQREMGTVRIDESFVASAEGDRHFFGHPRVTLRPTWQRVEGFLTGIRYD